MFKDLFIFIAIAGIVISLNNFIGQKRPLAKTELRITPKKEIFVYRGPNMTDNKVELKVNPEDTVKSIWAEVRGQLGIPSNLTFKQHASDFAPVLPEAKLYGNENTNRLYAANSDLTATKQGGLLLGRKSTGFSVKVMMYFSPYW